MRDRTESRPDVGELPADFALFLGTPAPHKNVRPALAAFARAKVPCVVVGWAGRSDIFDFAGQQAPPDQVRVLGRLSDAEVVWLLRRATALVFPSLYEGFGLPLLEAQSQGCAVIASNAAALPEVAGDGALYFDPADPEAAVAQFLRLRDGDIRARLIEHARANLTRFSWERSALAIADMAGIRLGGVTSPR